MSTMKTIGRKAFSLALSLLLAVCIVVQVYALFTLDINERLSLAMFAPASFLAYAIPRIHKNLNA